MAKKTKEYTSEAIQVLTDREHVRLRLPMYLGNTDITSYNVPCFIDNKFEVKTVEFIPAALKCVNEIIDNSIDEFTHITKANKKLKIVSNNVEGRYSVSDNGRGVPIDVHPQTGLHTPETVFGSLRSGRNFGEKDTVGIIGMNGVGSSLVTYVSKEFIVDIKRDKQHYHQVFSDGAATITKPKIKPVETNETGTMITFQLDPLIFNTVTIDETVIHTRSIEVAFNNPGVTVDYNKHQYKFKDGFNDVLKHISNNNFCFTNGDMSFYVSFDTNETLDEQIFTWVNGTYLFEGGICNTQFFNAFVEKTVDHLTKEAKKQKCEVTKNDVRQKLTIFGILKLKAPNFDSQSKCRLTGPNLKKEFVELVDANWSMFIKKNKDWLEVVLARSFERHHAEQNKDALKKHQKNLRKNVPGLIDATSTDRHKCTLYICEGLSAASTLTEVRNPKIMGSYPLGGKINVTWGCTVAQILKMNKIANILAAMNLTPGKVPVAEELRYGRCVLAADFDPDGADITTILVGLFYGQWKSLMDPNRSTPYFYRLLAPNVIAIKGKERVYFQSMQEYEKAKSKYTSHTIKYIKGLGSLETEDWERITTTDDYLLPIIADENMDDTLELLFGDDADRRKDWLTITE